VARTALRLSGKEGKKGGLNATMLAKTFPLSKVESVLTATSKHSERNRLLPAHVMVYYVIAMTLFMGVSCREVLRWLMEGLQGLKRTAVAIAAKSAISQARARLGWQPIKQLYDEMVVPIAQDATRGAWYRGKWRIVSIDGSTLDVADEAENAASFGRPGASRGKSGFPQIRFVALVENGTHVLFGAKMAGYRTGENTIAKTVLPQLKAGMLCLADRGLFSYASWKLALSTGADCLWRVKKNADLPCEKRLADGSYLSRSYPTQQDRRQQKNGIVVRVIEYRLEGVAGAEPIYRLITSLLDPEVAPAHELAALYHERWEIETSFDELKTHLRGARIILRSKTPDLVKQEFYGLLLAHFAIRGLMHEAALTADLDPDRLSFVHTVRIIRRKLPWFNAFPPSTPQNVA